ncbi:hypothetical protein C5167_016076 [Papaver somniferum]|nr:hypothetical protein C5167_016076 [Papaver somniferum]
MKEGLEGSEGPSKTVPLKVLQRERGGEVESRVLYSFCYSFSIIVWAPTRERGPLNIRRGHSVALLLHRGEQEISQTTSRCRDYGSSVQSFNRLAWVQWRTQSLAGKSAGMFYNTGSQGGGQERTA